jgi:hypothetical protein
MVTAQVSQMPDFGRRNKAGTYNEFSHEPRENYLVTLEKLRDPLGVLFVGFLAVYSLDILWVRQAHAAGLFKDVEHWNPVFASSNFRLVHAKIHSDSMHTSLQLWIASQSASFRKHPVNVENRRIKWVV